ncbi:hypothetical protein PybrP1_010651 [[Pythium] brassicae (nom. inval.)]|nr:hypothetical protein PybrP1_010651 [[Pythium] brassicae (nom. inval.)]
MTQHDSMRAEPKDDDVGSDSQAFDERREVLVRSDEEIALAARQFTVAGVVSTKARRLEDDSVQSAPLPSYSSNCAKELLCLEYVASFQRQFEHMFGAARRPLFLFPPNEKGTPKFVCTTIRPTLLPFRDLYDHESLARFLAGVIEYEPLADPCAPPRCLPSPTFTLRWRAGDSFDFAVLLASFLVGAGYDAYVAYGTAPRWICLLDQSKTPLPTLSVDTGATKKSPAMIAAARESAQPSADALASSAPPDAKLASRSTFVSKYAEMQKAQQQAEESARQRQCGNQLEVLYDDEDDEDDPLDGKRVHAWVLVRAGKRGITDHFFIEPSTGRVYSLREAPYLRLEAVWSHENYWVNMQQQPVYTTLFDLANPTDWEYVFLSAAERRNAKGDGIDDVKGGGGGLELGDDIKSLHSAGSVSGGGGGLNGDNQHGDDDDDDDDDDALVLDVPPSWVAKLSVDRATYRKKFVTDAQRVTLYRRAKVEEFAENSHDQGLVARVTRYRDAACTLPVEIRETFKNRKDKLESRARFPLESRFEEHFGPGRVPEALRARLEWVGYRRELHFYTSARLDGLRTREEFIQKRVLEHFEHRDDFLVFRAVTLTSEKDEVDAKNPYVLPGGPTGELAIKKMKEKFARNAAVAADADARKKTYDVQEGTVRVHFHYATGKITAGSRVYSKTPGAPVEVATADPSAARPKRSVLDDELRAALQAEKDCYTAVRHAEIETQDILKLRKREEMAIVLETSFFDAGEEDATAGAKDDAKDHGKEAKQETDYLTPFLRSVVHASGGDLGKDDAQAVREIQREHDQGTDEEFERFCSETMFRIQILEQRLAGHEETALQKYAEMDQRLHNDPRLRVLHR